jgi:hypothetical protein
MKARARGTGAEWKVENWELHLTLIKDDGPQPTTPRRFSFSFFLFL